MIMDPSELRLLAREMDSPACEMFEQKLVKLHGEHTLNNTNIVLIPRFWCETVYNGIKEIIEEFPNVKFGSIIEVRNRPRVFSVPAAGAIEKLKLRIYNKIDILALDTIDRLLKGDKKPFFML